MSTDTTTGLDVQTLTGDYTLDTAHSRIGFVARHAMVTKVRGSFRSSPAPRTWTSRTRRSPPPS